MSEESSKACGRCGIVKPLTSFYMNRAPRYIGRHSMCKLCINAVRLVSREKHRNRYVAAYKVSNAVRAGHLKRMPCEICGEPKAQGHHDDYSKPLDVRWLCRPHHEEWHKHNKPKD